MTELKLLAGCLPTYRQEAHLALEAQLRNAIATEVGEYDFTGPKGERYRFITLYNGRENLTLSLAADCPLPEGIKFGTEVNVWFRLNQATKNVRGETARDDRNFSQIKLQAVNVELAKAALKQAA